MDCQGCSHERYQVDTDTIDTDTKIVDTGTDTDTQKIEIVDTGTDTDTQKFDTGTDTDTQVSISIPLRYL